MRRRMSAALALILAGLIAVSAGCGKKSSNAYTGDNNTLYVYNWGEYISTGADEGTLDVNGEFEKLTGIPNRLKHKAWLPVKYVVTMAFVCLGWLVFRADSLPAAADYFRNMFCVGTAAVDDTFWYYVDNYLVYLIAAAVLALPVAPWLRNKVDALQKTPRAVCNTVYAAGLIVLFLVAIAFVVKGSYNPFIYFNF